MSLLNIVIVFGLMSCVVGVPFDLQEAESLVKTKAYEQPLDQRLETDHRSNYKDEDDGQYREGTYSHVNTIPGVPGQDYPVFDRIPRTQFSCADKMPGFYADEEAFCQVWHYCKTDGHRESFLCPNGTIYSQTHRVCAWWFNVRCEDTTAAYQVNEDLYIIPPPSTEDLPENDGQLYRDQVQGREKQTLRDAAYYNHDYNTQ